MTTMLDKIESLLAAFEHACILRDREAKEDVAVELAPEAAAIVPLLRAWERASWAWDVSSADPYKGTGIAQCKALYAAEQKLLAALRGVDAYECSNCTGRGHDGVHDPECPEVAALRSPSGSR